MSPATMPEDSPLTHLLSIVVTLATSTSLALQQGSQGLKIWTVLLTRTTTRDEKVPTGI